MRRTGHQTSIGNAGRTGMARSCAESGLMGAGFGWGTEHAARTDELTEAALRPLGVLSGRHAGALHCIQSLAAQPSGPGRRSSLSSTFASTSPDRRQRHDPPPQHPFEIRQVARHDPQAVVVKAQHMLDRLHLGDGADRALEILQADPPLGGQLDPQKHRDAEPQLLRIQLAAAAPRSRPPPPAAGSAARPRAATGPDCRPSAPALCVASCASARSSARSMSSSVDHSGSALVAT